MNWPPTFSYDAQLLDLLTGDRFYSAADAALREAVLNAIDACGRRRVREPNVEPSIEIVFDLDSNTVTISDNGDGMSREELGNLFACVGASASRLARSRGEEQFKAVGEFGIGVVSYFLVCDEFEVHTRKPEGEALAVRFSRGMFDLRTPAKDTIPDAPAIGTRVVLFVKSSQAMDSLLEKFPHWMRGVDGLSARSLPDGRAISQGGLTTQIRPVHIDAPQWVEKAELGPPADFDVWTALDGRAHVDVLYRGVFVQRHDVERLWGIEGALHVDPKHFKPSLNRESFVGAEFQAEVQSFLQKVHPVTLLKALEGVRKELSSGAGSGWKTDRWVTLWLAVPRCPVYAEVARRWDEEFWNRRSFQLIADKDREVSLAELASSGYEKLYVRATNWKSQPSRALVSGAVKVLRAKGLPVIQGIQRDSGYLSHAALSRKATTESLLSHFQDRLPELVQIESVAEKVLSGDQTVAEVFSTPTRVRVVRLGADSGPVVKVRDEIWVNCDSEQGRSILRETCDRNEGYIGLLVACQVHAPAQLSEIAALLRNLGEAGPVLGPVKRQYLRGIGR